MSKLEVTKRGNIKIGGVKFYAVPYDKAGKDCVEVCPVFGVGKCPSAPCMSDERRPPYSFPNTSVVFVSKEEYTKYKEATA